MLKTFYCRLKGSTTGAYTFKTESRSMAIRIFCRFHEIDPDSSYIIVSSKPAKGVVYSSPNYVTR